MRRFVFNRMQDPSDFSGVGIVAEGVQFSDGKVALRWLTDVASTVVWDCIEDAMMVHGHDGATFIIWSDDIFTPKNPIHELKAVMGR